MGVIKTITKMKKEVRFYTCLILAYVLLLISLYLPPLNVIATSVLYASIVILGIGALSIGLDISGILKEVNDMIKATSELKKVELELAKEKGKENEDK